MRVGHLQDCRIRHQLLLMIGGMVVLTGVLTGSVNYFSQRQALLRGIDERLMTAAYLAEEVAPDGYFRKIDDRDSVSADEYERIVAEHNRLCQRLDLQYLWSCMVLNGQIVFTTATSPSKDVTQRDHAGFLDVHSNPEAFAEAFATMEPDFSSFENEWGRGRMVLVPKRDSRGRQYCLGASVSVEDVHARLRQTLLRSVLVTAGILLLAMVASVIVSTSLSKPIMRLTEEAAVIAHSDSDEPPDSILNDRGGPPPDGSVDSSEDVSSESPAGCSELQSLTESIRSMEQRIQSRLQTLQNREQDLRVILESISDGVVVVNSDGLVAWLNPIAEELFDHRIDGRPEQALSEVVELRRPEDGELLPDLAGPVLAGDVDAVANVDAELATPDGVERRVVVDSAPLRRNNHVCGVVLLLRDVTDRHALQEQLHHSQKMEAVGQLAGGIAHDFNNMLGGIMGSAEMLTSELEGNDTAAQFLDILTTSAERAAELVSKLLSFARKGKVESTPVDVHEIIENAVLLLQRSVDKQIAIETGFGADCSVVIGDPSELESILLNLGLNARDAMPDGGVLTIHTANAELDPNTCEASPFAVKPGMYLELTVTDTGVGMDEKTRNRVFEPFFTTKGPEKGTGLGLAAVYGAVEDHHGAIHVESTPGVGTSFHLLLPVQEQAIPAKSEVSEAPADGSGCILVVDDEEIIRSMAAGMLHHLGYDVCSAVNGKEAVEIYAEDGDNIDLVLLDVVMPQMGGRECLKRLKQIDPDVKVLVASGFTAEDRGDEFRHLGALGFLRKPYTRNVLSRALKRALAGLPLNGGT